MLVQFNKQGAAPDQPSEIKVSASSHRIRREKAKLPGPIYQNQRGFAVPAANKISATCRIATWHSAARVKGQKKIGHGA
jgi:hypothetical protein